MRILIIGYSSIAKKRVIPALQKLKEIDGIDIATRHKENISAEHLECARVFDDYQIACTLSQAELVYVSLVNSEHAVWAERILKSGRHVIIDKPACISFDEARKLVELADNKNLCCAEATVYAWHPQVHIARTLFDQANTRPTRLTLSFSFPPFSDNNFRYQKHLGGGALLDLGPYAVTPGRLFFNTQPEEIVCRVCSRHPVTGVDTAFSVLAVYHGGCSMIGHFDFNTEYRNHITILSPQMSIDIDRVFTTPPDLENNLIVKSHNTTST
ncbi:MAG: Gfo/Idh/MocA family oxidoreductase, partial [Desulfobacterota bacterium]|nr:Gfo/Idh/MocA family oxidoreductase [Thermodesulfobacteriota bacterium]